MYQTQQCVSCKRKISTEQLVIMARKKDYFQASRLKRECTELETQRKNLWRQQQHDWRRAYIRKQSIERTHVRTHKSCWTTLCIVLTCTWIYCVLLLLLLPSQCFKHCTLILKISIQFTSNCKLKCNCKTQIVKSIGGKSDICMLFSILDKNPLISWNFCFKIFWKSCKTTDIKFCVTQKWFCLK